MKMTTERNMTHIVVLIQKMIETYTKNIMKLIQEIWENKN